MKNRLEKLKTNGKKRSPLWGKTKKDFEKKNPKVCAACGKKTGVQLHHIRPFHLHPELELDQNNLIWLCENQKNISCHLILGHWGSFKNKFNPTIRNEAPIWLERLTSKTMGIKSAQV